MKKSILIYSFLIFNFTFLIFLNGCATVPKPEYYVPPPHEQLPGAPKLKYLYDLMSEKDLYAERTFPFNERLRRFFLGIDTAQFLLIQPGNVCADENRVYVSDLGTQRIIVFDFLNKQVYTWTPGGAPAGLAVDKEGKLYVCDTLGAIVKVLGPNGNHLYTIGKPGWREDEFTGPQDLAINQEKELLYVLDRGYHKVLVFDLQGNFLFQFGAGEFFKSGTEQIRLYWAQFIALDKQGKVYITDSMLRHVLVFSPEGKFLKKIGGPGDTLGFFGRPKGVAVDSDGNIYVSDVEFSMIQIFNQEGAVNFFWKGVPPLPFAMPEDLYVDEKDRLYIVDMLNQRIQVYQYLK